MRPLYGKYGDGYAPRVSVRLPRPQHDQLTARAEAAGVKVSELIRRALDRELELANAPPDAG